MDLKLQLILIACIVVFLAVIFILLKQKKLNLKYTLLWFLTAVALLVIIIFPNIIVWMTNVAGIVMPVNFVFFMEGLFVLVLLLSLTSIVSRITSRISRLTQTQALLEKRIRDLENQLIAFKSNPDDKEPKEQDMDKN